MTVSDTSTSSPRNHPGGCYTSAMARILKPRAPKAPKTPTAPPAPQTPEPPTPDVELAETIETAPAPKRPDIRGVDAEWL